MSDVNRNTRSPLSSASRSQVELGPPHLRDTTITAETASVIVLIWSNLRLFTADNHCASVPPRRRNGGHGHGSRSGGLKGLMACHGKGRDWDEGGVGWGWGTGPTTRENRGMPLPIVQVLTLFFTGTDMQRISTLKTFSVVQFTKEQKVHNIKLQCQIGSLWTKQLCYSSDLNWLQNFTSALHHTNHLFSTAFHSVLSIVIRVIFSWQWSPIDTILSRQSTERTPSVSLFSKISACYTLPCSSQSLLQHCHKFLLSSVKAAGFVAVLTRYSALTLGLLLRFPNHRRWCCCVGCNFHSPTRLPLSGLVTHSIMDGNAFVTDLCSASDIVPSKWREFFTEEPLLCLTLSTTVQLWVVHFVRLTQCLVSPSPSLVPTLLQCR